MSQENNPYQPPESDLDTRSPDYTRDVSKGRRAYVFQLFLIWVILPLVATFLARATGLDEGGVTTTVSKPGDRYQFKSVHLDMLYVWYLSFPLFVWVTYRRLQDTNLSPWLTILFILPLINLVLWFWPPARK
jgi:uncharacterized membrane protein YhaH (DUF805 family)